MNDQYLAGRKSEHIHINLKEDVQHELTNGLEKYVYIHDALPEINLREIDLSLHIFNKRLDAPILVSSMTGGTVGSRQINQILAEAAQQANIALGVGSQRAAIEDPGLVDTFQIRKYAPDILLFSNLGAVQLNYGYSLEHCQRAVDMIEADGLFLHLNPLQEALQPEGNTNFKGLLKKIEIICRTLPVPVIVKEVGWGISEKVAHQLVNAGVSGIDVAGAGGTSWSQVEMYRATNEIQAQIASSFRRWGIPTSESILQVRKANSDILVFASGGLTNGLDIAKCITLGAEMGGMAGPFLKAASRSLADVVQLINKTSFEIQICMFAAGAINLSELKKLPLVAL
jgi:isopentenyl-diphosphate Delta-isomerase